MPRGGKRPGSGRRLGSKNRHRKKDLDDVSREVLRTIDSIDVWQRLLHCNSPKIVYSAISYLTDRCFGRPSQTIQGGSQPVRIEFSLAGWASTPEWLTPADGKPEFLPAKGIPQQLEAQLVEAISQIEDTDGE
jgi:hypothetical protein